MNQVPKRRGRPPKNAMSVLNLLNPDIASHAKMASAVQIGGDHYRTKTIQPWDAMSAWMSKEEFVGFLRGNALKYLARCNDKGGVEDIKKAQHYIQKLLEVLGA